MLATSAVLLASRRDCPPVFRGDRMKTQIWCVVSIVLGWMLAEVFHTFTGFSDVGSGGLARNAGGASSNVCTPCPTSPSCPIPLPCPACPSCSSPTPCPERQCPQCSERQCPQCPSCASCPSCSPAPNCPECHSSEPAPLPTAVISDPGLMLTMPARWRRPDPYWPAGEQQLIKSRNVMFPTVPSAWHPWHDPRVPRYVWDYLVQPQAEALALYVGQPLLKIRSLSTSSHWRPGQVPVFNGQLPALWWSQNRAASDNFRRYYWPERALDGDLTSFVDTDYRKHSMWSVELVDPLPVTAAKCFLLFNKMDTMVNGFHHLIDEILRQKWERNLQLRCPEHGCPLRDDHQDESERV